jgi:hypothetical protein
MFFNIAEMIFFSEALVAEMCHADPVEARSRVHLPWSLIPGKENSFLSFEFAIFILTKLLINYNI